MKSDDDNCEKSENDELEFEGAIVSKSLRRVWDNEVDGEVWNDEDTAGDDSYGARVSSEGEKRDACDNGRCNGGPSPAASETLEPAAWVRLQDVIEWLEDRFQMYEDEREEHDLGVESDLRTSACECRRIANRLREFTQNMEEDAN